MLLQGHLASPSPHRWISSAGATQQLPALPPQTTPALLFLMISGKGVKTGMGKDGKEKRGVIQQRSLEKSRAVRTWPQAPCVLHPALIHQKSLLLLKYNIQVCNCKKQQVPASAQSKKFLTCALQPGATIGGI